MRTMKRIRSDGKNTSYRSKLLPGDARRMPKGFYRDNMRAPK